MCMYVIAKYSQDTVGYIQICTSKIQSDTVRYSQIHTDMNCFQECIYACILVAKMHMCMYPQKYRHIQAHMHCLKAVHMCMYAHVCIRHTCTYVYDIHAHMHMIQLLCESRYMQIQAHTCRYSYVCISYTSHVCDMHFVISCAYERVYVSYTCFRYIHIYQCICVVYVLQIHAHMHWQDH